MGLTYLTEVEEVVVCGQHAVLDCHCHQIYLVFVYVDQSLDCAPYWHVSPSWEIYRDILKPWWKSCI